MTRKPPKFSPEVRERAVRLVTEHQHQPEHESQWSEIQSIAGKIGATPKTLLNWVCLQAGQAAELPTLRESGGLRPYWPRTAHMQPA